MPILTVGSCVYLPDHSPTMHLNVLLTEPEGNPRGAVVANLTTDLARTDTVLLEDGHALIKQPTGVFYRGVRFQNIDLVEAAILDQNNPIHLHSEEPICTPELLQKLRDGLMASPSVAQKFKDYCASRF